MFWKHLSLLSYNVKHQNPNKQLIVPAASVWVIVSRLLKRYQCSGDGWKLQEQSVELNCWQQESQYISRSSNWLLFLHDMPTVLSWIVNTHCLTVSQLHFFPLCRQENCAPTRLWDRWNSCLWLAGCGGELSVLHVCKLPPEVYKMVPSVNSSSAGPLQRPEINFGAFILWERHTMGVR